MYIEEANIKVIGTKWDKKDKQKKGATLHEFKFDDGIQSKTLAKFLENLQEDGGHQFCGKVTCNITIDTTEE
jgi:hypothetical protein|tara:strand:+ start:64 stop:279 length:216 start_codon:yes stop_codon:yes gene_type:complete